MCQGLIQRLDMRLFSEIRSPGDVVSDVFAERVHAHRFGLDAKFCQPFFQAWILQGFFSRIVHFIHDRHRRARRRR